MRGKRLALAFLAVAACAAAVGAQQGNAVSFQVVGNHLSRGAGCRRVGLPWHRTTAAAAPSAAPRHRYTAALHERLHTIDLKLLPCSLFRQTGTVIPRAARFAYAAKRGLCWCA